MRLFTPLVQQMKAYNYDDRGKPRKLNDDCVDSMLCAMQPFMPSPYPKLGYVPFNW